MSRTLINLNFDGSRVFDSASLGVTVKTNSAMFAGSAGSALTLQEADNIKIERNDRVDKLEDFTIELVAQADMLQKSRFLMDSETPPLKPVLRQDGCHFR